MRPEELITAGWSPTQPADPVQEIAAAWAALGRPRPTSRDLGRFATCTVDSCASLPFALLQTTAGPAPLCLRHYLAVRERSPGKARRTRGDHRA